MVTNGTPTTRDGRTGTPPVRTCIGCRGRDPRAALLRVVAEVAPDGSVSAVPDPARVRPGRGAWMHRDAQCLAAAVKRRAFARALRVAGWVDTSRVAHQLSELTGTTSSTAVAVPSTESHPRSRAGRQVMSTP